MKRKLYNYLQRWKTQIRKKPLLIRGARQVGKTYLISQFGKEFEKFHSINFELEPEYKRCFQTLKPNDILQSIALQSGNKIIPGKSLLFLDEIQECPNAIISLRYYKELLPELHVIGAGSLLEFALEKNDFSMPVGRIQFVYMKPLSFREFLIAHNYDVLDEHLKEVSLKHPPNEVSHHKLLDLTKQYAILGGMPEVHEDYLVNKDLINCQKIQTSLLNTYRLDFGKYSSHDMHTYLQAAFDKTPHLIGKQIKYVDLDRELRSRGLKKAIDLLERAGVIQRVYASAVSGIPLNANLIEKKFKLIYLDVGLANRMTKIDINTLLQTEIGLINSGHITEQLVGQELLAYLPFDEDPELYFWSREKIGSQAEIDYVVQHKEIIIPIEVKAGQTGRIKSLRLFMDEKKSKLGVKISKDILKFENHILSVPYYLISELHRLIDEALAIATT